MNKKIISYAILPVLGLAILGASTTFAASNSDGEKPIDALVSALATKFNLNSTEVQTVVEQVMTEQRATREAEHNKTFTDRLNQAVADKKLTQDQVNIIIAKQKEIQSKMADFKNLTGAEHRTVIKKQMASLKQWALDNNIPKEYLMFGIGGLGFGHHGPRGEDLGQKAFHSTIK